MFLKPVLFILAATLCCSQSFAKPHDGGDRSDPSTHAGHGAIPYGGADCQIWNYEGTGWGITGQVSPDLTEVSKGSAKWVIPLSTIGLSSGDTLRFRYCNKWQWSKRSGY